MTTPRPAVRPMRYLAAAVAAGALLATTACSGTETGGGPEARTGVGRGERPAAAATGTPSPSATLTEDGARLALITEAQIEDAWTQVEPATARSWRDSLLLGDVDAAQFVTGKADVADCQRLTDALFDETLLGRPSGASALTGFQEGDSRLLYQVATYDRKTLDDSMRWLKTLPQRCDSFTLTGEGGGKRTVEVVETSLPDEGDARQGLTVTVRGEEDGGPVTLTLAVAVVRVGTNAITVTQGGVDGARASTTRSAVQQGTQRLEEVLAGRTPAPSQSVFD
ncbi:hypothetical protein [Streptomyces fragilis]|uniref:Lipoprotein n=1 Tax=Streptomyces fragilis TaxID=67301 RepID=A0ABV2YKJ9_9ACTN|nr:hypothetical protein [Streptomyces fragilis]